MPVIYRTFRKKLFLNISRNSFTFKEKEQFDRLIHLFSPRKLLSRTGKSVASREFLGKVVRERAVVPPINGNSYLGWWLIRLVSYLFVSLQFAF